MLPRFEFRHGGHMAGKFFDVGKGDDAPTPNYQPLADSSTQAASIMAAAGDRQIAEARRQYDLNYAALSPVVQKQLALMDQSKTQGDEYYDYMLKNQRPVEEALNKEAMTAGSDAMQEQAAGKAVADVRQGTTSSLNQAIRQGLRYGYSPAKIASMTGANASRQGLAEATAANAARDKERNTGYAKRMDVAGLYRGLTGASQGAYGLALNSGQGATGTQMAPGAALMSGMSQGASMTGQGLGLRQQGLGSVLNAQTNAYTASQNQGNPLMGLAGMGLGAWASNGFSTSWFD